MMNHLRKLAGAWIEIGERGDKNRFVLMRPEADIPALRGGRRRLEINAEGQVLSMEQGANDRMEITAKGDWDLHDETIKLKLEGWEGDYDIENMTDTELILNRR